MVYSLTLQKNNNMILLEAPEGCEDSDEDEDFRPMIYQIFSLHFLDEASEDLRGENVELSFEEKISKRSYALI